jgi:ATP-dependent DNA helicase RecG
MSIPEWADCQLSKDLPILRSKGENQDLEYISVFPQNVRDIGKEIAAFATSNNGTILIGVDDDGTLVGIDSALTSEGRDEFLRRIEGICRGTVKPSITPTARFAFEDNKVVLVLFVPKGSQPVYYNNNKPYVRHITESRPAEPHEVVELISKAYPSVARLEKKSDSFSALISHVAPLIFDVIIFGEEREYRIVNPWLNMWRSRYKQIAVDLRELAIQNISIQREIDKTLNEIADSLDRVANMRLHLGCGEELNRLIEVAVSKAKSFKQTVIDSISISEESFAQIKDEIFLNIRKLENLNKRVEEMIEQGRIEEVQSEVSKIGYSLSTLFLYNIEQIPNDLKKELYNTAKEIHLIETMRSSIDGGRSLKIIQEKINNLNILLDNLIKNSINSQ